jgi:hypothetical protein
MRSRHGPGGALARPLGTARIPPGHGEDALRGSHIARLCVATRFVGGGARSSNRPHFIAFPLERWLPLPPAMRKAFVLVLLAVALACSDRTGEQSRPSTIPPSSPPTPPPPSRVVLSGRVYAAASGGPDHYPSGSALRAGRRVDGRVVAGVQGGLPGATRPVQRAAGFSAAANGQLLTRG